LVPITSRGIFTYTAKKLSGTLCKTIVIHNVADADPGSGMGKKSGSGYWIQMRDEPPGSYFREVKNNFLMRIRVGKNWDLEWKKNPEIRN
jgi:hypothetical protein